MSAIVPGQPYRDLILPCLPRARSLMDRTPSSPTIGSADRDYWNYRTLTDFSGGSWQQVMLGFAVLSTVTDAGLRRDELRTLACAALTGWLAAQHRDGSVDEWYLNERSYCATGFGAAGVAQTILLLGENMPPEQRGRAVSGLARAAAWLETRWHHTVMNQNLAATLGLWCAFRITGEARWKNAALAKYHKLAQAQSPEGWFPEYGGADWGYSTLALDLLAGADEWGVPGAAAMAEGLCRFLVQMQGRDGGFPGRIGSRGTSHAFPFGAEHFAARLGDAATLARGFRAGYRADPADRPIADR